MAERATLNISLTPEQNKFIASKVSSGSYLTASEVVREALRLLQEHERLREMHLEELRSKIQEGLDALDRGEKRSGEEVFCNLKKKIKKKRNRID